MKYGRDSATPVFYIDKIEKGMVGYALLFSLFFVAAIASLTFSGEINYVAILLAVGMMYGLIHYWNQRVRKAKFYEDHFSFSGRSGGQDVSYSKVRTVSLVKAFSLWEPRTKVNMQVDGFSEPLRILGNPTNKKINSDLYSWLKGKVNQSGTFTP
jgi:hypothetical protein